MRNLETHRKALNKLSREMRPIAAFLDDPNGRVWLDGNRFEGLIPHISANQLFAIHKSISPRVYPC